MTRFYSPEPEQLVQTSRRNCKISLIQNLIIGAYCDAIVGILINLAKNVQEQTFILIMYNTNMLDVDSPAV